jgi:DNA-binding response OmpR family regulator
MIRETNVPTVLVVEDDEELNELERELLAIHGFESIPAYTGVQAVELCKQMDADAVLLDVMLPQMDGFEACVQMRKARDGGFPIIIISALNEQECRQRGMASGANAYFAKPFNPEEVIATLQRLIHDSQTKS